MIEEILFKTRDEWRSWLDNNHQKYKEVWLIYYKKHTKKQSVLQPEAVEEALCYGWIDSIVKRIDDKRYKQKFTPRNDKSIWSDLNKNRVSKLIKDGKMAEYGLAKINIAKKNGMWNKIKNQTNLDNIPKELEKEISDSILFKDNWNKLTPSHKKQYLYWINDAKRNETKLRRIDKVINALNNNEKIGLV